MILIQQVTVPQQAHHNSFWFQSLGIKSKCCILWLLKLEPKLQPTNQILIFNVKFKFYCRKELRNYRSYHVRTSTYDNRVTGMCRVTWSTSLALQANGKTVQHLSTKCKPKNYCYCTWFGACKCSVLHIPLFDT